MENNGIFLHADKSRINMGGQLYNCVDSDIEGLFRNSLNGDLILVGRYLVDNTNSFYIQKRQIERSYFQEIEIEKITENELYELESGVLDIFHSDERLSGLIYPYLYEIQEDVVNNSTVLYTINEVPGGFGSKYKKFENVIEEPKFSINLRISAILDFLELMIVLNEKFHNFFQTINMDAVFINIENGDVKILLEQQIAAQSDITKSNLNEMLAYMIFELLCMANPYDGKKTLVKFPLLTKKTVEIINRDNKDFIFANNDNGISKYMGKDTQVRWNALPDIMRNALEDNLDLCRAAITYDIKDWNFPVRNLRDLLVYVNGHFRFCNPSESKQVLFFKVDEYMVPIWPRKAIYGYHVEETDYAKAKKVILGVNQEGKIVNYSEKVLIIEINEKIAEIKSGDSFVPESGMKIIFEEKRILVVNSQE